MRSAPLRRSILTPSAPWAHSRLSGIVTAVVGRAECTLDQRDLNADVLAQMYKEAVAASKRFAEEERCTVEWSRIWSIEPIPFHPKLVEFAEAAILETAGKVHRLPSGRCMMPPRLPAPVFLP